MINLPDLRYALPNIQLYALLKNAEADRDKWKARAEAFEVAVKENGDWRRCDLEKNASCMTCVHNPIEDGDATYCNRFCIGEDVPGGNFPGYEFDEFRYRAKL